MQFWTNHPPDVCADHWLPCQSRYCSVFEISGNPVDCGVIEKLWSVA
jgi:hypothetical protein